MSKDIILSDEAEAFIEAGRERPQTVLGQLKTVDKEEVKDELVPFSTRIKKSLRDAIVDYCHEARRSRDGRPDTQQAMVTKAIESWLNSSCNRM
jgi:hypothetical protein